MEPCSIDHPCRQSQWWWGCERRGEGAWHAWCWAMGDGQSKSRGPEHRLAGEREREREHAAGSSSDNNTGSDHRRRLFSSITLSPCLILTSLPFPFFHLHYMYLLSYTRKPSLDHLRPAQRFVVSPTTARCPQRLPDLSAAAAAAAARREAELPTTALKGPVQLRRRPIVRSVRILLLPPLIHHPQTSTPPTPLVHRHRPRKASASCCSSVL